jgi:hypothetical protein
MRKIVLILSLVIICLGIRVKADSIAAPYSYKKDVSNGKYVLVMLAKDNKEVFSSSNKKYTHSGLYLNDGSVTPLWTMGWYEYEGMLFIAEDGEHAAGLGPWPNLSSSKQIDLNQLAVTFYNKESLMKEYYISDLIKYKFLLRKSVSHFEWREKTEFDISTGQLTILTKENNKFIFDINSGNKISGSLINRFMVVSVIILLTTALLGLALLRMRY